MKQSIKGKVVKMAIIFFLVITGLIALFFVCNQSIDQKNQMGNQIIALNEIEKLTQINGTSPAKKQIEKLEQVLLARETQEQRNPYFNWVLLFYGGCVIFLMILVTYLYYILLRPFEKLELYAGEIAKGNMEVTLNYERNNFFGAFTWSFDHMRKEIKKARACEKEAIENNKTVIATLSHDIKTPIASIRAYAEGLEANMDSSPERRNRYLSVIMKKCDEVTKLTNDLLLHSLSDLDKLQIQRKPMELSEVILQSLDEISGDYNDIIICGTIEKKWMKGDHRRFEQVLENIINNARKYAHPPIMVWSECANHTYEIHIKDSGSGIEPEDAPFIFNKFYRGRNVEGKPGSGLGLYIVKYIMNQMDGEIVLQNKKDGCEVILIWRA